MRDFILTDERSRVSRRGCAASSCANCAARGGDRGAATTGTRSRRVVAALGEAGYLELMFRDLYRGALAEPGLTHATHPLGGGGLPQLCVRDDHRHRAELRLSAAPPCDGGMRERYLPAIVDGRDGRRDLCDRAGRGLRHVAACEPTIAFDAERREWVINGLSATSRTRRSPTSISSMASAIRAAPPGKGLSAVVVPARHARAVVSRAATRSWAGAAALSARSSSTTAACRRTICSASRHGGMPHHGRHVQLRARDPRRLRPRCRAQRLRDRLRAHAQSRDAFGQKLGCKQLIWNQIAEMSWRIDAAELITYRAAKLYDRGHRRQGADEAGGDGQAGRDRDRHVLRRRHRADPGRRRPHQGIRPRRADLSRRARAADRRRHLGDGQVPHRLG